MGGLVLVGSTFDWDPKKTPEDLWLGGRYDDLSGAEVRSRDGLAKAMDKNFKLVHEENVPQVSRVTSRKFELTVVNVTIWQRTG